MSTPKIPQYPIAGNQGLETLMKFVLDAEECAKRYEVLKEMADLATQRIEQVVKVKELEGAHGRMLQSEKTAAQAVETARKKAQGMIDEAEGVVAALYADFEEAEAKHKAEYKEFQRDQAVASQELGRREEAAAVMREEAEEKLQKAEGLRESASKTKAEYEAKAKALDKAMGR